MTKLNHEEFDRRVREAMTRPTSNNTNFAPGIQQIRQTVGARKMLPAPRKPFRTV